MIEIDGIEISEDTVKSALKKAGIELVKFGEDIEKYCKKNVVYKCTAGFHDYAYIKQFRNRDYVCVPLPTSNNTWVLEAYQWVKDFMEYFKDKYELWITYEKFLVDEEVHVIWISYQKGKTNL